MGHDKLGREPRIVAPHMIRLLFLSAMVLAQAGRGVQGPPLPAASPPGLEVELRTVAGKSAFRLSEIIPLEIAFRSSRPATHSIELADGWNEVPQQDRFLVQPGESVIDRVYPFGGIVCCKSSRPFLRAAPAVYPHELTDFVRFTTPGTYQVQYSTRRIFTGPPGRTSEPSDLTVRSNVLTLTLIHDERRWLEETLRAALRDIDNPPPLKLSDYLREPPPRGSLHGQPLSAPVARYLDGRRRLRMLDTPLAIQERVRRLQMPSVDEWRASSEARGNGYSGVDDSVTLSSRPDLVAAALTERATAPEFGVTRGYFEVWAQVEMERDHPEMFRLTGQNDRRDSVKYGEWRRAADRELLDTLRKYSPNKTGVAAEMTLATIRAVERELAK